MKEDVLGIENFQTSAAVVSNDNDRAFDRNEGNSNDGADNDNCFNADFFFAKSAIILGSRSLSNVDNDGAFDRNEGNSNDGADNDREPSESPLRPSRATRERTNDDGNNDDEASHGEWFDAL